ncbi:MAG: TetR/AcrR family transcriptional regulator [Bacteroidales bacterium]|nr:TetR/AcrR family transcriptional regulator [Bacteroidales bacterium]
MSPRTTKQFEEIRETRKKQIMEIALELFADMSYSHTSISMIASKAKISKGLMYNYFSGKESLLVEIMEHGFDEMVELLDPNKDGILTKEEFEFFIDGVFDLIDKRKNFYRLYFALVMQPSVSKLFEKKINEVLDPLIKLLVDYYTKKGAKNPQLEAMLIGALFDGIGFHYVFYPGLYPLEEVKKIVKERFV